MGILVDIAAVVPMTAAQMATVTAMVNAGATAAAVIAFLGGGGIIAFLIQQAFKNGATKVILAA
ncbi:hypothetical protein M4S82_10660 [Planococcus sp. MERTA32b]|nr:hypothetical protein [Planococcus sp. MER TA 32b]